MVIVITEKKKTKPNQTRSAAHLIKSGMSCGSWPILGRIFWSLFSGKVWSRGTIQPWRGKRDTFSSFPVMVSPSWSWAASSRLPAITTTTARLSTTTAGRRLLELEPLPPSLAQPLVQILIHANINLFSHISKYFLSSTTWLCCAAYAPFTGFMCFNLAVLPLLSQLTTNPLLCYSNFAAFAELLQRIRHLT